MSDELQNTENTIFFAQKNNQPVKQLEQPKRLSLLCYVPTKGRYWTTLPLTLQSIITQTRLPDKLIIFDDGEHKDLREQGVYKYLFRLLDQKGIQWSVVFGEKKGQVLNHQKALQMADTDIIARIDDDVIIEPNVFEVLMKQLEEDDNLGAIASLVIDPTFQNRNYFISSKIEDVFCSNNLQWIKHSDNKVKDVDHLYSSFLYRKKAASSYQMDLSPVGFREETMFSYQIKRNGYKLSVDPNVCMYHLRNPEGGIRENEHQFFYEHDAKIFAQKLNEWNVKPSKLCVLNNGKGDNFAFKMALPKIRVKYPKLVISSCFPEVFEDEKDITLISIGQAETMCKLEDYNIYGFMAKMNWNGNLVEAFEEFYTR